MTGSAFVSGPNARFLAGIVGPRAARTHTVRALGVSMVAHVIPLLLIAMIATKLNSGPVVQNVVERSAPLVWTQAIGGQSGGPAAAARRERPMSTIDKPASRVASPELISQSAVPTIPLPPTLIVPELQALPGVMSPVTSMATGEGATPGGGATAGTGKEGGVGTGNGDTGFGGDPLHSGTGATAPVVVREVKPGYTSEAMRARIQGKVVVRAVVMQDGSVAEARVIRSLDRVFGLDDEALKAVRQWKFNPGRFGGKPVAVPVDIELTFVLR